MFYRSRLLKAFVKDLFELNQSPSSDHKQGRQTRGGFVEYQSLTRYGISDNYEFGDT
jgi:hypothetical protein